MSYVEEFPSFPEGAIPAIPEGFEDVSWHNDVCPSFKNDALSLTIYVDYPDPNMRELESAAHFMLVGEHDEGLTEILCETDHWHNILEAIEVWQKAA